MSYLVKFFSEGNEIAVQTANLERALALAGLLEKIETPEVKYENLSVNPKN